ncbi:MAG: aminodeoxychorismate synthase component I [Chromatiales bacterium]|nr:aminodeoxychorismate synthase component I [Gammaproteobacteria bacterium]MBW6476306.1 aminodeoxychorismate synthase component I [Chromatiales bacterium]
MHRFHHIPLPYPDDVSLLFASLAASPWAMWLDGGPEPSAHRHYDILVADPYATLITEQGITHYQSVQESWQSDADPFSLIQACLQKHPREPLAGVPFAGGALGIFAYDLARCIEPLPELASDDLPTPPLILGLYDWAVIVDHRQQCCQLVSWQTQAQTREQWSSLQQRLLAVPESIPGEPLSARSPLGSNMDAGYYRHAFARIQRYLHEGDCYQVNFSQRLSTRVEGDPFAAYCRLRSQSPAPFGAYLNTPYGQILCNSPERFLSLQDRQVETCPIKGTRPRLADPEQDALMRQRLLASAKDRAENVMIVDLLRNDLSRSCRTGTVRVPELFRVESYATVHQLVSRITAQLRDGEDACSLLRNCFPGGSITGAPKLRAMQIIEELEPQRRGIYCGAIAWLGFDGNMDSNIVIRTALHRDGQFYFSVGGGIVSDSRCEDEYQETFHKAEAFFRLLNLNSADLL